ncbi:GNAT family N-acetyltransferase [Pseudoneobacillus sp. C159]
MGEFLIKKINNLFNHDLTRLLEESKEEGFRFVERLVNEYQNGTNTFHQPSETLFGIFTKTNKIIAICGLNIDPFSNSTKIGRLRRFYVGRKYRRNGVGSLLLKEIILQASNHFDLLVLHTDTNEADQFYTALGFSRDNQYPNSTHFMNLKNEVI